MRFIHIADVHLGASPDGGRAYSRYREQEIWDTFSKVIGICEEEKIDLLLIAGDLFHRQPLLRELKEVDFLFSKLSVTKVVFIVGNHDYIKENSFYKKFNWSSNVYPILSEQIQSVEIDALNTSVFGCSYHSAERTENELKKVPSIGVSKNNILLMHGGDEKHIPFRKNEVGSEEFDYIALGHIHQPQELVSNHMAYAGSLEPTDIGDIGKRGYIKGELDEMGVRIRFVGLAKREYKKITIDVTGWETMGKVKEELSCLREQLGAEHMYIVVLEGIKTSSLAINLDYLDDCGNIVKIIDNTRKHYDIDELRSGKEGILVSEFIKRFGMVESDSVEYKAMLEGVDSIMRIKRGYE